MVVKSKSTDTLIADLTEVFKALKVYRWKLNPTKCIFGIPSGILLGNIVSRRGIEANPEKIAAVINMKPTTCVKDVQKLTGCMAALSRFISRLGEKGLPVGVSNEHQLVNLYLLRVWPGWCTKGHKVYTGSGRMSLHPVCCCLCY